MERSRAAATRLQAGPLMDYEPTRRRRDGCLAQLAEMEPRTLAIMHGSSFAGNGAEALGGLGQVYKETFDSSEPARRCAVGRADQSPSPTGEPVAIRPMNVSNRSGPA